MAWVSKAIFWIVAAFYAFGAMVHRAEIMDHGRSGRIRPPPEEVNSLSGLVIFHIVTIALIIVALWLRPSAN